MIVKIVPKPDRERRVPAARQAHESWGPWQTPPPPWPADQARWAEFCRTVEHRIAAARSPQRQKQCTACGARKSLDEFQLQDRKRGYFEPTCRACKLGAKWERRKAIKRALRRPCSWCGTVFAVPSRNPYQEYCCVPCSNAATRIRRAQGRAG